MITLNAHCPQRQEVLDTIASQALDCDGPFEMKRSVDVEIAEATAVGAAC